MTPRTRDFLTGLTLVVLALVAYANSFSSGLVLDNSAIIGADPRITVASMPAIVGIFKEDYWWPTAVSGLYRPLTTLSYWFNYTVLGNGTSPFGYHVVNFALHAANIILLWRLALYLGATAAVALGAAALFAVHPLGTEAVTNIVGRADLFATLGVLATSLMWLRGEDAKSGRAALGWRIGAGLTAFVAVFTKETGVLAAGTIGLLLVWRYGWRKGVVRYFTRDLPIVAPAIIAIIVVRVIVNQRFPGYEHGYTVNPLAYVDIGTATMTAIAILGRYVGLFFWPGTLSCDYSYSQIPLFGSDAGATIWAVITLLAFAGATFWLWRRRAVLPLVGGGLLWAAVMILPTSNLFVKVGTIMAERFLYLPMTGLAVAAVAGLLALAERYAVRPATVRWLAAGVLCVLTVRTLVRNADWKDEFSLWTSAAKASSNSYKVHKGLAVALVRREGNESALDRAIARAEVGMRVLESPPLPLEHQENSLWGDAGELYRLKGELAQSRGEEDIARMWFEKSAAILDKAYTLDRWINERGQARLRALGHPEDKIFNVANSRILTQRALTLLSLGKVGEAVATLRALQEADPLNTRALMILAMIDRVNGDLAVAAVRLVEVTLIQGNAENAVDMLHEVYKQMGLASALTRSPTGQPLLEAQNPEVKRHINTAFLDIVDNLKRARHTKLVEEWQMRGIRDFGVPPEIFEEAAGR